MNRVLVLIFGSLVAGASPGGGTSAPPNILFISIDDLNDWVGVLRGHPQAATPNLDRLARRGILFRKAYCNAPLCNPSRASLMTGVLPSTSGVYENPQDWRRSKRLAKAVTLPQYFRRNGYFSAGGGKLYHSNQGRLSQGFDHAASWDVRFPSRKQQLPDPAVRVGQNFSGVQNRGLYFDWGPIGVDDARTMDGRTVDWAIGQLAKTHEKPFFLAVGIYRPHIPWYVPKKYFDAHPLDEVVLPRIKEDDLSDVPREGRRLATWEGDYARINGAGKWRNGVQAYLACIRFADAMLGRLLDAWDRSPYSKNALLCLWSDHGWHLGEKNHWQKWVLWEESTRVPLIFVAPGVAKPGAVCNRTVTLVDIYPTLVELAGLKPGSGLDGRSLVPLLREPERPWDHPALMTVARNSHAIRTERWRYIRYADGTDELYDHDADGYEWTNLAGRPEHARVKKELARSFPTTNAPEDPPRRRRKKK